MCEEEHLRNDVEFGNLLELLDANQSSSLEAQRSVSLRKVRQTLRKSFLECDFADYITIIEQLSQVEVKETNFDDLVTVTININKTKISSFLTLLFQRFFFLIF